MDGGEGAFQCSKHMIVEAARRCDPCVKEREWAHVPHHTLLPLSSRVYIISTLRGRRGYYLVRVSATTGQLLHTPRMGHGIFLSEHEAMDRIHEECGIGTVTFQR